MEAVKFRGVVDGSERTNRAVLASRSGRSIVR